MYYRNFCLEIINFILSYFISWAIKVTIFNVMMTETVILWTEDITHLSWRLIKKLVFTVHT